MRRSLLYTGENVAWAVVGWNYNQNRFADPQPRTRTVRIDLLIRSLELQFRLLDYRVLTAL